MMELLECIMDTSSVFIAAADCCSDSSTDLMRSSAKASRSLSPGWLLEPSSSEVN